MTDAFSASESFCPLCGPGVSSDQDGCCGSCGATLVLPQVLARLQSRMREHMLQTISLDAAETGVSLLPCHPTCAALVEPPCSWCDCGLAQQRGKIARALDDARDQGALEMRQRASAFVLKCRAVGQDLPEEVFDILSQHIGLLTVRP